MTKTNVIAVCVVLLGTFFASTKVHPGGPYQFYALTPCRIVDTRNPNGPTGGPVLYSDQERFFPIAGWCNVPTTAVAVALNVTIVSPSNAGHLTLYPYTTSLPLVSTLNFAGGESALANGAIVPITANPNYNLTARPYVAGNGTVHVILDVTGYFQ